ncbi:MAG: F0F1 ATP synthase subunit delta [Burkholderiaceae bacterium]|nr:F0F1 ATP synthase subunit delta [Burkholderiaceae bacterium]
MAELSTIARPYAEALFNAAQASGSLEAWVVATDELATLARHPQVAEVVSDPKLGDRQVFDLLTGLMKSQLPAEGKNFLQMLIDNDRLAALPEIARQFRVLKNQSEGVADCLIESAFPMNDAQVSELLSALAKKFALKLKPDVRVDASLIGGVRVTVGDHVLDTSVKTRLAQMQAALTAA